MTSTYTQRNRYNLQGTGDNLNTWGSIANQQVFAMMDESTDGITSFTLSGSKTLTSANGTTDEARKRILNITSGTGGTVTIPSLEKNYLVHNQTSGDVIITTGGGATATVPSGSMMWVYSNAVDVSLMLNRDFMNQKIIRVATPTAGTDGANKSYADGILTQANAYTDQVANQAGNLPNQTGFAGRILQTDGTAASWQTLSTVGGLVASNNLSDLTSAGIARTNLGLGDVATRNIGTSAGTVAAGDDARIVNALQNSNNLSDVSSAATARTNLGLGTVATESILPIAKGGTGGTSQSAARTNLGLGSAAVQADTYFLKSGSNLSDLGSLATALANLGNSYGPGTSGYFSFQVEYLGTVRKLYLQWTIVSVGADSSQSFSWPIPFPNTCHTAIAGRNDSFNTGTDAGVSVHGFNASGGNARNGAASTATIAVWGIGY